MYSVQFAALDKRKSMCKEKDSSSVCSGPWALYPGVSVLMDERLLIDSCLAQRPGVFGTPVMLLNVADYVAEFCNLNELVWGILVFLKLTCIPILESIPQSGPWL
jgi:hypothetical protein